MRWLKFNAVGAGGILVQASVLALATKAGGLHYLLATAIAVEAAVLHNFVWHQRWTWSERVNSRSGAWLFRLLHFNLTTGIVSIAGNLFFMWLLAGAFGIPPIAANLVSIAACSLLNYFVSDRSVFA